MSSTTREALVRWCIELAGRTGFYSLTRHLLGSHGAFVLEFHGVPARSWNGLPTRLRPPITRRGFERILEWLSTRFSFISPDDFFEQRASGVLLTFDDGFANLAENVVPVLERFGAPAVFFITTQHVEDSSNWLWWITEAAKAHWGDPRNVPREVAEDLFNGLSPDQVRLCADNPLISIGAHTVSHPRLTGCSDEELREELLQSRRFLEELTSNSVDLLAYPHGDYDGRVAARVRDLGFRAAFAEAQAVPGSGHYGIPRIGVYSSSHGYLAAKLSGLHTRPVKLGRAATGHG